MTTSPASKPPQNPMIPKPTENVNNILIPKSGKDALFPMNHRTIGLLNSMFKEVE